MKKVFSICAAGLSALFLDAAHAHEVTNPPCPNYSEFQKFDQPLTRTSRDLAQRKPIRIVALGSSSTKGYGASHEDTMSYPAQLEARLKQIYPEVDIAVINRGKGGDVTRTMFERFEEHVINENPQLVLLQTGANEVLKDGSVEDAERYLTEMLGRLRKLDIDVIVVDNQFAPIMNGKKNAAPIQAVLENISKEFGVPLMRRGDLMKRWHEQSGIALDDMLLYDGFHMKDFSYSCFGRTFAGMISGTIQQYSFATYGMK